MKTAANYYFKLKLNMIYAISNINQKNQERKKERKNIDWST